MAVYVDDMRAPFGRMKLCHMIADTPAELHAMALRLGMRREWVQDPGTYREHYDVAMGRRAMAVGYGAVELTQRQLARLVWARRPRKEKTDAAETGTPGRRAGAAAPGLRQPAAGSG